MSIARTPDGKWVLFRVATGERLERWPVDARPLIATGEYTTDPLPGPDALPVTVAPGSATALPPALPLEHSPGVPLVAVTDGEASTPFAALPSDAAPRRKRK
jgi:hypothetical protein